MPDPNLTLSLTLTLTVTLTVTRSCLLYWPTNYQQFAVLLPCCCFFWSWACNHVETTPGMAGEPGPSGRRAQAADWPRLAGAQGRPEQDADRGLRSASWSSSSSDPPPVVSTQACKNRMLGPYATQGSNPNPNPNPNPHLSPSP